MIIYSYKSGLLQDTSDTKYVVQVASSFISKLLFELRCLCMFPSVLSFCKKTFLIDSHIKKCLYTTIQSRHIFKKDENGGFIFDFFWIRSVQNGSNLIKLDQIGFPHQSTNVTIKSFHIYRKDKMAILFLIFLDQICPKWIKLDKT